MGGASAGPPNNHHLKIQHANEPILFAVTLIYSVDVIHWSAAMRCVCFFSFTSLTLFRFTLTCARFHTRILQSNKWTHTHTRITFMVIDWMAHNVSSYTSALLRRFLHDVHTHSHTASADELFQRWFCCGTLQYHQISWRVWFAFPLSLSVTILFRFGRIRFTKPSLFHRRNKIRKGKKLFCVPCNWSVATFCTKFIREGYKYHSSSIWRLDFWW